MTPQEPAMGVSDEMIAAAASAYNSAAVAEGFHSVIPSLDATHLRWMRAALLAALPHMQPAGEAVHTPDGYVYRYPDGYIRHSNGKEVNAMKPIETIPYYYGKPPATQPAPVDVRLREIIARKRAEADRDEDAAYELGRFDSERRDDLRRAAKALRADADEINLALLSAQPSADAGDGERLAYVLSRIPVTELEDWLGVSIGDYMEVPTIDEHRAAIDAAIEQEQTP